MIYARFVRLKDLYGGYYWINIAHVIALEEHSRDASQTDVVIGPGSGEHYVVDHPMDEVVQLMKDATT